MSTQGIMTARLNATCRHELRERLRLGVDPSSELSRLNSIIQSCRLTLPDLQQLISTPSVSSVLSTLAPVEFSRIRTHMAGGSRSALETTVADLQAELAETLAVAISAVTAAIRYITATTFARSGIELGYTATTHHAETATCVELCRRDELMLVAVHDDGDVEFVHGKFSDQACGEHQRQLERTAEQHGVLIVPRVQVGAG